MVTTGFRSSRLGVEDQQYTGNVYVQEWTGCAPKVLDHLGVSKGIQIRFAESGSQSSTILLLIRAQPKFVVRHSTAHDKLA